MKTLMLFVAVLSFFGAAAQEYFVSDTVSFVFLGDIMGHDEQICSAYDSTTQEYNYDKTFEGIKPIISEADFAIGNLEVTLAGKPYSGYPRFSSPDALAIACKKNGIDALVTANNHCCDRGKKGVLRTINVLDSLGIQHTGTFRDSIDRFHRNLLLMEKGSIRVGLLNYTYGTNGLRIPKPTIVNRLDTLTMLSDIEYSKMYAPDKLIVVLHWGYEYHLHPSKKQKKMADFLFRHGVDVIIGGHPHVLQKMDYWPANNEQKERLIAYSLGNFVSNQRTRNRDGGAMFQLAFARVGEEIKLINYGYHLTWVHKKKGQFEVVPCLAAANDTSMHMSKASAKKMKIFVDDSRKLLNQENHFVPELKE